MSRTYLQAQLSLSLPSMSNTFLSALMFEGGIFAGFEHRTDRNGMSYMSGGPFNTLKSTFNLLTIVTEVITQVSLLLRTLFRGSTSLNSSSILLILLALAPSAFRLVGSIAFRRHSNKDHRVGWLKRRQAEQEVKDLGRKRDYKQEIVLFGLKDWVLGKWDEVARMQAGEIDLNRGRNGFVELCLGLGQHSVQTAFYVSCAVSARRGGPAAPERISHSPAGPILNLAPSYPRAQCSLATS